MLNCVEMGTFGLESEALKAPPALVSELVLFIAFKLLSTGSWKESVNIASYWQN